MEQADLVKIAIALALSRNFMERYPQGRTDSEEAAHLLKLNSDAIVALGRAEGTKIELVWTDYYRVQP